MSLSSLPSCFINLPLLHCTSLLQSRLLHPLFSSIPSNAPEHFIRTTCLAIALYLHIFERPLLRKVTYSTLGEVAGITLMASEGIVRLFAKELLRLGPRVGVLVARCIIEGPVRVPHHLLVLKLICSLKSQPYSKIFLSSLTATIIYMLSFVALMIEGLHSCYSLQAIGLAIATASLVQRRPSCQRIGRFLALLLLAHCLSSITSSHCPTSSFSRTAYPLRPSNRTTVLASQFSATGMIVVGEHELEGHWIRYLRADHSILGGLWIGQARDDLRLSSLDGNIDESEAVRNAESIYSTFSLQEIVILVDKPARAVEAPAEKALIIGLGAGISARALHNHGLRTTIVELDPVVYRYAREYFGVEEPRGGAFLQDARSFMNSQNERFDYVIHDVFTGGSIPSSLFTAECFSSISQLLRPHGIAAFNYAGYIDASFQLVATSILDAFRYCRAFEDGPAASQEYRNMLILCSDTRPIIFRPPTAADFIATPSPLMRQHALLTFLGREYDLSRSALGKAEADHLPLRLMDWNRARLDTMQEGGAVKHWEIMQQVLSDEAWAAY